MAQETVPAKGHTFGDWIITEPTETTSGSQKHICEICGYEEKVDHNCKWEYYETHDANCTTAKEIVYICRMEADKPHYMSEFEGGPVHQQTHKLEAVAPTYLNTGLTEGEQCGICGKILAEQTTIDQLPLTFAGTRISGTYGDIISKFTASGTASSNGKTVQGSFAIKYDDDQPVTEARDITVEFTDSQFGETIATTVPASSWTIAPREITLSGVHDYQVFLNDNQPRPNIKTATAADTDGNIITGNILAYYITFVSPSHTDGQGSYISPSHNQPDPGSFYIEDHGYEWNIDIEISIADQYQGKYELKQPASLKYNVADVIVNTRPQAGAQATSQILSEYQCDTWTAETTLQSPFSGYQIVDSQGNEIQLTANSKEANAGIEVYATKSQSADSPIIHVGTLSNAWIDTQAPEIAIAKDSIDHDTKYVVTFSASDHQSGVAQIDYTIDGITYTAHDSICTVTIDRESEHTISAAATDNTGNTSAPASETTTIMKWIVPVKISAESNNADADENGYDNNGHLTANGYCAGQNAVILLEFPDPDHPRFYNVEELGDEFLELSDINSMESRFSFQVTNDMSNDGLGNKEFNIRFRDNINDELTSEPEKVIINIGLSNSKIKMLYSDVLFVDNKDGKIREYQWYMGDHAIEGANKQYYQSPEIPELIRQGTQFSLVARDRNGNILRVCPQDMKYINLEGTPHTVSAYPNPASEGETITITLGGFSEEELAQAKVDIYRNDGVLIQTIPAAETITTTLPSGTYSGQVQGPARSLSFKIIVK